MAKIKPSDIQRIYAIGAKLGILESGSHDDMLHQLVYTLTGKDGVSSLTSAEAVTVIKDLEHRSGYSPAPRCKPRSRATPADYPPGQMTEAQGKMAWGLAYDIIKLEGLAITAAELLRDAADRILGTTINTQSNNPWRMISQADGSKFIESLKRRCQFATTNRGRRKPKDRGDGRGS